MVVSLFGEWKNYFQELERRLQAYENPHHTPGQSCGNCRDEHL